MASRSVYKSETTQTKQKNPRFDPLHPGYIQQEEEGSTEFQEFEEDIGISRTAIKRKHVRTDVHDL